MNSKLTLKLDDRVISRAKKYVQHRRTSLSKMVESYLDSVTKPDSDDIGITPLVKSLSGVISLPENYDYKEDRTVVQLFFCKIIKPRLFFSLS